MGTDGKENQFEGWTLDEEQADEIKKGNPLAIWAFILQNYAFLRNWARKFIRNSKYLRCYQVDEFINQIFVDCPYYNFSDGGTVRKSVFVTFRRTDRGGYLKEYRSAVPKIWLDAPAPLSSKGESGATIGELLASREPTPEQRCMQREQVEECIPRMYSELKRIYIEQANKRARTREQQFTEILEYIFPGMTFEEVERYAICMAHN